MDKQIKYIVFKTKWGWFGLAAGEKGILRSCLPCPTRKIAEKHLLAGLANPKFDRNLLKSLQNKIISYFAKKHSVRHLSSVICPQSSIPIALDGLTPFSKQVLTACRTIPLGQTATYSALAKKLGRPRACRAVGSALAKNPIPLIIPCHRIIRSDGQIGNFSAPAGPVFKAKLLKLEQPKTAKFSLNTH